jgi:beta-glucosidase-like glycosyl hydrolase/CubicO group peptidase (beta-lactamase class C family)
MVLRFNFTLIFVSLILSFSFQSGKLSGQTETDSVPSSWADSVLSSLTLEEKIAQLMMIRTYSNKDQSYYSNVEETIKRYNIGGLCFFQGGPLRQAILTNRYQEIAKTPLFISIDAEWGLGMRLDSTFSFPYQMTLGAVRNNDLIYEMGDQVAKQLKMTGVHINFAPVADVNNNPANPVINSRSFGESEWEVAQKSIAYMLGLQDNGIMATAKHFPGHGDTDSDSHYTLPVISHTKERLDSIELYPFKLLIGRGLDAIMVAHLFVPGLDSTPNTPTTLSSPVITNLLKNELGFKGLVITDALDMKGVTSGHKPGEIELKAFLAGNDILLLPQDVKAAINVIKSAVDSGLVTEERINERCLKILNYKQKAGLDHYAPVKCDSLYQNLNDIKNELITRKIYEDAVTVIKNENQLLPLVCLDTLKIATVAIGSAEINAFQTMLSNYTGTDHFNILNKFTESQSESLIKKLSGYNLVIVSVHNTNIFANKNFGLTMETFQLLDKIAKKKKVILAYFGNPYGLDNIQNPTKLSSIILGYQDTKISNEILAQVIMGGIEAKGRLPVLTSDSSLFQSGTDVKSIQRFKYTIPEEIGIASTDLEIIDSIVLLNIREKAIPGCQVLVAKDGKVIYRKSFGYHTYESGDIVENSNLYDLASLTKVAATTLSVMKLSDEQKLDIDQTLSFYLPELTGTNKEDIIIRELMAHQAQLKAWIAFYLATTKKKEPDPEFYSHVLDSKHTVKVAMDLYLRDDYKSAIYDSIIHSPLLKKKEYVYSDLGFYFLKQIIEKLTEKPLDKFVEENFYRPMGLQNMCYNPLEKFDPAEIIPTEADDYFRNQKIQGYVHDPGAAMLGGVAGHAGLFSNANDLAILMQMLLQGGEYGGRKYVEPGTITEFTKQQFPLNNNRRAIGFDKPDPEIRDDGPTCTSVSDASFGHTGFTGTYAWADPEYNLIYIFLSNRTYPTAQNTKLSKMKTRKEIQQVIYDAIQKAENFKVKKDEINSMPLHVQ